MKEIEVITSQHPSYQKVCDFADGIYLETIGAGIRTPPDTMIMATENGRVCGCVGLSSTVSSGLFLNDGRFYEIIKNLPQGTRIAEQNILAVRKFPAGIPLLISTVVAFARSIGIQKIAFAGIPASCKAVQQLGYQVTVLGKTELRVFSEEEKIKYRFWLERYRPVSSILDTEDSHKICQSALLRFSKKAVLVGRLQSSVLT